MEYGDFIQFSIYQRLRVNAADSLLVSGHTLDDANDKNRKKKKKKVAFDTCVRAVVVARGCRQGSQRANMLLAGEVTGEV